MTEEVTGITFEELAISEECFVETPLFLARAAILKTAVATFSRSSFFFLPKVEYIQITMAWHYYEIQLSASKKCFEGIIYKL